MIPLNLDTQGYSLTPSMLSPALPLGASYHTWSEGVLRFGGDKFQGQESDKPLQEDSRELKKISL